MLVRISIPPVGVLCALVLGLGSGAALCKYRYDCHVHALFWPASPAQSDASLLRRLTTADERTLAGHFNRGYRETEAARGFSLPTDFAFLPDGDVLVSEKAGLVLEADLRTGRSRIVLDLSRRTADTLFRGLVTVAVDPGFARNRFVYVLYTLKPSSSSSDATTVVRFSRFVLPPSGRAHGERILLGSRRVPSCTALPTGADCLPSDVDHVGGEVAFARDGSLFVSTGDGGGHDSQIESTALRAQNPDSLAGKVLHITRGGAGLPSNPFWNGDPQANRSKVWAIGLRNPFRLTIDPANGRPVAGDVGSRLFEEIDEAPAGRNLGWPCLEGSVHNPVYARTPLCRGLYTRGHRAVTWPIVTDPHYASDAIVGGAFVPSSFPRPLRGGYVYGSWVRGWLKVIRISGGRLVGGSELLANDLPGPIAIHDGPDGTLYVLCLNTGDLLRVTPP